LPIYLNEKLNQKVNKN